jgi:hypothetical protein
MSEALNTVSGTIYDAFNVPVPNLPIQIFDKDLRTEQLLGQVVTDTNGHYSVSYDVTKFADSEYKTADVFIRIVAAGIFLQSPVYFNVSANFVLDFKVDNTPIKELNEFDALVQIIKLLTEPQKVALADIRSKDPDDITFLANETGIDATRIAFLPIAFTWFNQTKIAADIFYGLFRLQFPTALNALLLIKTESIINGINSAISQNIISAKWKIPSLIDPIIQLFNQLASVTVLSGSNDQSATFKQVIGAALPKPEQQQTFVSVFLANEQTPEKFWDALAQQPGFTDPKVIAGIQSTLQLNLLTNYVPSLTTLLFSEQQQNPALSDLRGFSMYTFDDWHTRIDKLVATGALVNFPNSITGATPAEKAVNYANSMTLLVKSLYPTSVFASQLSTDTSNAFKGTKTDLTTFFANNVDFDLNTNSINTLFDSSNQTGITDKAALKKELTTINLLSKITDDYSQVSSLRLDGIDSATALVSKYTPTQFAEKYAPSMSPETAAAIYQNAEKVDNLSTVLAMGIKMRNDVPIYAINGSTNDTPPDYESMFNDTNCDCTECQSVYSPSAYFVDILNLTQTYNSDALKELTARRPDLVQILLTCKNTNTPLPYIDLVNELLENVIAPIPSTIVNGIPIYPYPQFQTTNSAEELLAYPEHVDTAAYDILKTANSAYNLPLDLPLEETRMYLDKLGIKRYGLMELFYGKHPDSKYNDPIIAAEYLQISQPDELNLVNGATPMPITLGKVADFLTETGLSYIEMLQLLECYFINPLVNGDRSIKIVSTPDQTSCDINELTLQTTNPTSTIINPFIRLWKKTGWNILDLDRAFMALGISDYTGDINSKLIIPISHIARLKAKFNMSVQNIVTLWSKIDTHVYADHSEEGQPAMPTQYESLFRNKQVTNPVDPDFSNPDSLSGTLAAKSGIIIAALNLSQKDFDTLNQTPLVDGQLTLANLSVLFRYVMLAKALKISIDDLISAINLSTVKPFGNSSQTADTLTFIDTIAFIRSSGFSLPVLISLLTNDSTVLQPVNVNDVSKVLNTLREGLQKIELLEPVGSTPQEQAKNKLQNQNSFISDTLGSAFKTESKVINVLINNVVKSVLQDPKPAITPFIDAGFIASTGPLFTIDSSNVIIWVFPDLFNTYVLLSNTWDRISKLVSKLKISSDEFIYFQSNEIALNISGIWNMPVSDQASTLFPAFENLSNIIRFRNTLAAATTDWYTIFDFAILNGVDAQKNFINSLIALSNFTSDTFEFLLVKYITDNDNGFLKFIFPADYLDGEVLLSVINCANMAFQLGSSVGNIAKLTNTTLDAVASDLAKSMLKSKYDVPTWLRILTPLSNQLRVKKRDALVSYVLTSTDAGIVTFRNKPNHIITDINSLYAYLLIDMEMDACMLTSRIKQAISSMQIFVDRCLMNLEPGLTLTADFTTQWNTWRKRYRIWEANRKIFLYPENWIEPELRDDKSPFFKDLESTLKQNDITDATAEDALRDYLEKLDAVANLEIMGVYPDDVTDIVHVIGRTRNLPHHYYYATQMNTVWSAWEKVDLDIEGDHILPVVWNNRLMLFWGMFTEKQAEGGGNSTISKPDPDGNMSVSTPPPAKVLEMKLAWSEYKNGKWDGKKISVDSVSFPNQVVPDSHPPEWYIGLDCKVFVSLNSAIENGILFIHVFNEYIAWEPAKPPDRALKSFVFSNCNSLPSLIDASSGVKVSSGLKFDQMLLDGSGNVPLSFYSTGMYKDFYSNSSDNEVIILGTNPAPYQLLPCHHEIDKVKPSTFFYNNTHNNLYVHSIGGFIPPIFGDVTVLTQGVLINRITMQPFQVSNVSVTNAPAIETNATIVKGSLGNGVFTGLNNATILTFPPVFFGKRYFFQTFYQPYVCELIQTLNTSGIDGLYKNTILDTNGTLIDGTQNRAAQDIFLKNNAYLPTIHIQAPYPNEQVDFSYNGMYSIYNWELFFHIPLLIATRLSQNQKFDEARKWFHYIFDPTRVPLSPTSGTERFWITKPFKEEIQNGIHPIEDLLNNASPDLNLQLNNWERNPFKPHAVARLRISAYMRSTVMKYIDNLIAWGDRLFQQDTLETINEATLLYVLAANMLGKKPEEVPPRAIPAENSFLTIQDSLDSFSNAKVAVQSFFSLSDFSIDNANNLVKMPLFCIPKNDILLGYWDTVADRLFKIRHCLNIEGVFQQLPLFEPPINPALLVNGAASGLDLNSILNDMNAPLPNYRFQVILQKANEICNDVKGLGSELLAALEKKDAEQLSLLHSSHEINLLNAVRDIKVSQVEEANANLDGLNRSKDVIQAKRDYYTSRDFINAYEAVYFTSIPLAMIFQNMQIGAQSIAAIGYAAPEVTIGPFSTGATYGGDNIGNALTAAAAGFNQTANLFNTIGTMANLFGNYVRRQEEWDFQKQSADLELKQMDSQIAAAEIRVAIAEKDLENHDLQIQQSQEVDDFLNSKYTNEELYDYMVGQISSVYFQSYQLAFNIAKKAEKCYQYELGIENTSFINFGYWDSLKKGLLSGEKLQFDLRRLDNAYLDQNKREYEIVKHISLILLDPLALIKLRTTGICDFGIPEVLYDLDFAGQYFRRIKSVSISLPCIAGPYTSVSANLSLVSSRYRKNTDTTNGYAEDPGNDDRFNYNIGSIQSIAASNAQNDSGIFELNFRDERYLPFEGTGAISSWHLELPTAVAQFDYDTISDVIIHVKYTAREGGSALKDASNGSLKDQLNAIKQQLVGETGLHIALDMKHDLSNEWNLLKNNGSVDLTIDKSRLPYMAQSLAATIESVMFIAKVEGNPASFTINIINTDLNLSLINDLSLYAGSSTDIQINTQFKLTVAALALVNLDELILVVKYSF